MKFNQEKLANIFEDLKTDPDKGLTSQQVTKIQKEKGFNKFEEEKKETLFQKILHQLKDLTTLILTSAAVISTILAITEGHGFAEPIVIMAIVIINTMIAVYQEINAEEALAALKKMHAHMTVVLRDGQKLSVDATELVPGDILVLEAGDMIPADARIIKSANLRVEESVLTGESVPVEKDAYAVIPDNAPLGDNFNMLFSGCLIANGRTEAVVVETGMNTEMGKVAGLLNNTERVKTPLQKRLIKFAQFLTVIAVLSSIAIFTILLIRGESIGEVLMNAVALLVAAVPETLYVIVTITLAFGVSVMAKKNAIIRKIPAVETIGNATVICSDKTGTLTLNKMTIVRVWANGCQPINSEDDFGADETRLIEMMSLASNAAITIADGEEKEIGDPTESAIIRLLHNKHTTKESLDAKYPKLHEFPFESERKLMTTVHKTGDGRYISITKGAFDRIPIDKDSVNLDAATKMHDEFASQSLRVIAVGYKYFDTLPEELHVNELENNLTLGGFVGMIDPPRPESIEAVKTAKEAGIRTIMITGDHVVTASAIAREIGILCEGDKVLTGVELNEMSQKGLIDHVKEYSVYARVTPEDKIRIVQAWQAHREVVAMTGDGVNDAPALKAADVGIAMGSGTDVSKSAADIVLADDNYSSIISAVKEGRRVYDNIRKALFSLLSDNFAEIVVILFAVIVGWGVPLVAIQLLYINVIADGVPDMFFIKEPAEDDIMRRPPADKDGSIFAGGLGKRTGMMSFVLTVVTLIAFYIGKFVMPGTDDPIHAHMVGQTMAFVVNAWSSIINSFNIRSYKKSLFSIGLNSNRMLSYGIFASIALTALVATLPFLAVVFRCVPLTLTHWIILVGLGIAPLIVGEIHKIFMRANDRRIAADGALPAWKYSADN